MASDSIWKLNQNYPEQSQIITKQKEEMTTSNDRESYLEYTTLQKCRDTDEWKPQ